MKSRRNFIAKTGMATAALLATNPFKALAGLNNTFVTGTQNHLVVLHTADAESVFYGKTGSYINKIRSGHSQSIFMHTSVSKSNHTEFDIQPTEDYQIIEKGGIKTGVICITNGSTRLIDELNETARILKKEKNCAVVVCISHLSHKKKTGIDNLKLASLTENIDMIIGNDSSTGIPKNLVLANKLKHEVIVQYPGHNELACGKVEFSFDGNANKKHVHFGSRLYQQRLA